MLGCLAAAFGRLCVETFLNLQSKPLARAAAFGRLCVETELSEIAINGDVAAAASARLSVETGNNGTDNH